MSADPIAWLTGRLRDLPSLLAGAEIDPDEVGANDAGDLAEAAPGIAAAVESLLARIRNGELGKPPDSPAEAGELTGARVGWL